MKGIYCLCIENHDDQSIKIGALGETEFRKGYYIYVGSALNSLIPRLERHLKMSRGEQHVYHWHIDYLLKEPTVELKFIYIKETEQHIECRIADLVGKQGLPMLSFGCSDCNCKSHLYKVKDFKFLKKIGLKKWYQRLSSIS